MHNVRYGDKKIISKIYTLNWGLQSYLINFGSSSKSKIKLAHVLPLNQVDLEVSNREKNEVNRITEIRVNYLYTDLTQNIYKNCIASFINEIIS